MYFLRFNILSIYIILHILIYFIFIFFTSTSNKKIWQFIFCRIFYCIVHTCLTQIDIIDITNTHTLWSPSLEIVATVINMWKKDLIQYDTAYSVKSNAFLQKYSLPMWIFYTEMYYKRLYLIFKYLSSYFLGVLFLPDTHTKIIMQTLLLCTSLSIHENIMLRGTLLQNK